MARVPVVSSDVMKLCRLIHSSNEPCYVEVRPWPHARKGQCYENVREKVKLEGGAVRYGWALWQPTGAFLAGEHHAVYEPRSGPPWVDITPRDPAVARILFLPDEKAVYANRLIDNVRLPVVKDERVHELHRLEGESVDIRNSSTRALPELLERRLDEIHKRLSVLWTELIGAYPLPA